MKSVLPLAAALGVAVAAPSFAQPPAWSASIHGPGSVSLTLGNGKYVTKALALDRSGNIFLTGSSTVAGKLSFVTTKLSASGTVIWQKVFSTASGVPASVAAVAVDASGNSIVTGPAVGTGPTSDVKILKYDVDGALLWEKRYDGGRDDASYGAVIDGAQDVIVAAESINAAGNADVRVLKFSGANGALLWQRGYDSGFHDYVNDIAIDGAGDVVVAGASLNAAGNTDVRVLKVSGASGAIRWQQSYDGGGDDQPYGLGLDAAGNAFLAGFSMSGGRATALAMKLAAADGRLLWRKNIEAGYADYGQAVAVDAAGDPAFAIQSMNAAGNYDFRTVKVRSADGITSWNRTFDSGADDFAYGLAFDGSGNVVTVGSSASGAGDTDWRIVRHAAADGAVLDQDTFAGAANAADDAFVAAAIPGGVVVAGSSRESGTLQAARVARYDYPVSALAAPAPGEPSGAVSSLSPTYLWTPVAGATGYKLRVKNGAATVVDVALTLSLSMCPRNTGACGYVQPTPLASGTTYTWQVAATNGSATSLFSGPRSFTPSSGAAPAAPVPGAPSGPITTTSPMFLWTPAPGATGYTLQVFTGAGALVSSTPLTLVEAQCPRNTGACGYTLPSALARRSAYTWRVSGSNAAGTGPYSASVAFVTP